MEEPANRGASPKLSALPPRRAYKINELKRVGGPSHDKAYREIKAGRLRAVKLGRHTVILADDFDTYLASLPVIAPMPEPQPGPGSEHGQRHGRRRRCGRNPRQIKV